MSSAADSPIGSEPPAGSEGVATPVTGGKTGLKSFPCRQCGARLEYAPGTDSLTCPYCRAVNAIGQSDVIVKELEYGAALRQIGSMAPKSEGLSVKCDACAAEIAVPQNATSFACPFCGSNIVATAKMTSHILPNAVLPFKVAKEQALGMFRQWVASRWFAPGALKSRSLLDARFVGMYMPAWTYDAQTTTDYQGQRGDAYYETEWVTVNGQRQSRRVRKIRWSPASGRVEDSFDDLLVLASRTLPEEQAGQLEPWDLKALVPYADEYLAGFKAECYTIGLEEGFETARAMMQPRIESTVRDDIGGDEQRIDDLRTQVYGVTYKHILLPVWMNAYRFNGKVYRFLVNARTGEVIGDRPYSATKITLFVLMCVVIAGVILAIVAASR